MRTVSFKGINDYRLVYIYNIVVVITHLNDMCVYIKLKGLV